MKPIARLSPRLLRRRTPLVAAVALVLTGACSGWQGDVYYAHRLPAERARKETTFRFGDPGPGWSEFRKVKNIQVAWFHPDWGAVIELHAQCDDQGDSSLEQYSDHLRIDWTGWSVHEQEYTRLIGRAALRTVVSAELDGVVRRNELWVVKKNGCLFDLRYSANPAHFNDGHSAFANVLAGFRFPVRG